MSGMHSHSHSHAERKEQAAAWSIVASAVITVGKGVAGFATGSLALISDAAHSVVDVAATTLTYIAVRTANKPADEKHHYGHGKVESLAALFETALLFILSGAVAYEGVRRLLAGQSDIEWSWAAIGVLLVSIVIDATRWYQLTKVARETNSEALAADALHFSSDLVNSVLVLAAFGAAAYGFPQADSLVAIGVSLFIALAGFRLAKQTIDSLLDTAPAGLTDEIRTLVTAVPGVASVEALKLRAAGPQLFVEVEIGVSRTLPLDRLSAIKDAVAEAVHQAREDAIVTVTATPRALDDETILERVLLIAAKRRVPVHHVTVQTLDGRISVSLDLEVDGRMTLGSAHIVASRLEAAIREELGADTEVETHIEPLVSSSLEGRDVDAETVARVATSLANHAKEVGIISDVHSVRVRGTDHGLIVNYHCRVDPALDVAHVHEKVDELEHLVRSDVPAITRIVSHTEPLRSVA
jgi:cation diffusion facilitator family transporter